MAELTVVTPVFLKFEEYFKENNISNLLGDFGLRL
jgi:hypothetical protein